MAGLDQEGGKRGGDGGDSDEGVEGCDELRKLCYADLGGDGEACRQEEGSLNF